MTLHSPTALSGVLSGKENDCQRLHALSRMDSNPTDISGTRRTGHQHAVWPQFEVGMFVCVVDIFDDLLWVKQDNEIMRQERDGVYLQFDVGEQYGAGFGHTHR